MYIVPLDDRQKKGIQYRTTGKPQITEEEAHATILRVIRRLNKAEKMEFFAKLEEDAKRAAEEARKAP